MHRRVAAAGVDGGQLRVYGCCVSLAVVVNFIGDTGAVAFAKALESGQCQIEYLNVTCQMGGKSPPLAACATAHWATLHVFVPAASARG